MKMDTSQASHVSMKQQYRRQSQSNVGKPVIFLFYEFERGEVHTGSYSTNSVTFLLNLSLIILIILSIFTLLNI